MLKIPTFQDESRLIELCLSFYQASPYASTPLQPEKIRHTIQACLNPELPDCIIIGWEAEEEVQGLIAGQCTEVVFSNEKVATETLFWVDPCHRKGEGASELLGAFEYWAKEVRGCTKAQMFGLQNEYLPVLSRYYTRKGYRPAEVSFVKEL